MNRRRFAAFLTVSAVASLMPVAASGQAATAPLRTPWGQPDLRGIWDFRTITPLQRPEDLAEREFLTAEQAADVEERTLQRRAENDRFIPGRVGAYNQFWLDQGTDVIADRRTALIVDPPNGRIPPLTPAGETRREARRVGTDSWENRRMGDRCLFASMPMIPDAYNNNVQLFQTPDYVALLHEMGNTTRIVPLDRRRRTGIRQWMGESRGHWEGATLVVETTRFGLLQGLDVGPTGSRIRGTSPNARLVERFTRVSPGTIEYEFTVEDPETYARPWTAAVPLTKTEAPLFEYACHEGNYAMANILSGARAEEKTAEGAAPSATR